jgi:hypothetical protein
MNVLKVATDVGLSEVSRVCAGASSSTLLWRGAMRMVKSEPTSYFGVERDAAVDCDTSVNPQRCGSSLFRASSISCKFDPLDLFELLLRRAVSDQVLRWILIRHPVVRRQRRDRDFNWETRLSVECIRLLWRLPTLPAVVVEVVVVFEDWLTVKPLMVYQLRTYPFTINQLELGCGLGGP